MIVGGLFALTLLFPRIDPAAVLSLLGFGSIAIGFAFKDHLPAGRGCIALPFPTQVNLIRPYEEGTGAPDKRPQR